jgi:N-dimethylarginine dimethylaminohydrolase
MNAPRLLMCPPDAFDVSYAINPWMDPLAWARDAARLAGTAVTGWSALAETYRALGAEIELLPAEPGVPDLVFTANHAVVLDGKVLLARYRYPERQGEEAPVRAFFENARARGLVAELHDLPEGVFHEGAGDAVWDGSRGMFWMGFGPRSSQAARRTVEEVFGVPTLQLQLVDPRFYHLDTCLFALEGGEVIMYPGAFSAEGRELIRGVTGEGQVIEADPADAAALAVNAFALGRDIVMGACSTALETRLVARGYRVHRVPLGAFALSGGSAYCLTLRLDRASKRPVPARATAAAQPA